MMHSKSVFLRFFLRLIALLLISTTVWAVELGPIKVESFLNQPLKAVIPLKGIDFDGLQDIKVSLADNQSYQTIGLSRPSNLPRLNFELISGKARSHLVQITSRQAIKDPILEILVQVLGKQSRVLRLYTLLIDPVGVAAVLVETVEEVAGIEPIAQQPVAAVAGIEPIAKQPVVEAVSAKPLKAAVGSTQQSQSDEKTIRVGNDSISIIAQNSSLHESYSVYPIMRAFYLQNRHAFIKGNIEKLQSGSLLTIPQVAVVAAVTRQQAISFVSSMSKDQTGSQPVAVVRAKTLEPTVVGLATADSGKNSQASLEIPPLVQTVPSVLDVSEANETTGPENQARSASVQSLVQQPDADKGIGTTIDDTLTKVTQIEPLAAAQVSNRSGEVTRQIGEVRNTLQNQQKVIDIQGSRIDTFTDLLVRKSEQIADLNQRVESIENELQMPPAKALTTGKSNNNVVAPSVSSNYLEPPVIALTPIESSSDNGKWLSTADIWFAAIVIFLVLLVSAFIWQGRRARRQVETGSDEQISRYASSSYHSTNDIGVSYVEKKSKPLKDEDDTTLTRATGKGPIGLSSSGAPSKKLKIGKLPDVYSEIDVYNGYELYEEAQKLLNAARMKYVDDPGLDLKQLEILARAKNFERFIYLYEEKQDLLAQHFPLEWPKITRLRDSLKSEMQEDIAH